MNICSVPALRNGDSDMSKGNKNLVLTNFLSGVGIGLEGAFTFFLS
jgi:hypothetical protein